MIDSDSERENQDDDERDPRGDMMRTIGESFQHKSVFVFCLRMLTLYQR